MAQAQQAAIELFGDRALQKAFIELGNVSAVRAMRPAMGKALQPVKKQAKANISGNKRSGALARSVAVKVAKRRNAKQWAKVYVRSNPQQWNGMKINPAKYAHLVEFGTRHSRPFPFMRAAMASRRSDVNAILVKEGWANLVKESVRVARKHGTNKSLKAFRVGRSRARRAI